MNNPLRKKKAGDKQQHELYFLDLTTTWVFDAKTGQCLGMYRTMDNRKKWYVVSVFGEDGILTDGGPICGMRDVTNLLLQERE